MKKILSAMLAMLMLLGIFSVGISAREPDFLYDPSFELGNVNGEDGVNAQDLFTMKSYVLGNGVSIDTDASDLEADGKINTGDMFYLKKLIVGSVSTEDLGDNKQTAVFQIAGKDISEFALVIPTGHDDTKNTHYAAKIFKKYVKETTGAELEIINDGSWTGHAVNFVQYEVLSEEGKEFGTEGYRYEVIDGNLNIYGTFRGNSYAVYEILEKYLGVRFFDDIYVFLYKQRYINMEEGTSTFFEPQVKFRFSGAKVAAGSAVEYYYYPSRMNGTQIYGHTDEKYGYQYGPQHVNAHSYSLYWQYSTGIMPPDDGTMTLEERYKAKLDSGEVIDQLKWQPCATNGTDYATMFDGMLTCMRRLENWPSIDYHFTTDSKHLVDLGQKSMSFSLNDNEIYCTCRNCRNKANGWTDRKTGVYHEPEGWAATYLDMANQAARDIQEYYPGMRIHCILYNHTIPATIVPDKNLIVFYCGQGCNNHYIMNGETECGDCKGQLNKESGSYTQNSLKVWGELCKQTGAEMWFWYYGVTYHYYLVDLPNITNIYYDYKYMFEECNVRGFYFESGGRMYGYSSLKSYMTTKMSWNPTMSYEEYTYHVKDYLYMYYGDGYEKIYEYIMMLEEAGDRCGTCFISNFDRPGDMYSYEYLEANYEYMRQLLIDAYNMAQRQDYKDRIETMLVMCEFMGLSSSHTNMYTNGDEASRKIYEERYTWFYNALDRLNITVFTTPGVFAYPETIDFTINPMTQFYEEGSRRPGIYP